MGNKFLETHKRKTAWAALLLIFRGRGKYAVILFVAGLVSVPFLVSGERLNSLMSFPAVAAVMRTVGLGGFVPDAGQENSAAMMAAAMSSAGADTSFIARFLKSANAPLRPPGYSSLAMLRGGGSDTYGPPVVNDKDDNKPKGPDEVKGSVSPEERAKGAGANVDLAGVFSNVAGGGGGYGDLMGANLGDRHGGGASGAGPYANRSELSGPGGAADQKSGMFNRAMNQAADTVPVPRSPKQLSSSKMGRVSNFAWKNMGRKTKNSSSGVGRLNSQGTMFRLSEAFTLAGMAFTSNTHEYESAYSGAAFDGNDVDLGLLETDAIVPAVPSTAFSGNLLGGIDDLQRQAIECANVGAEKGTQMGDIGKEMGRISETIDYENKPQCCPWNGDERGDWNGKVRDLRSLCYLFNPLEAAVAAACQIESKQMECEQYDKMIIDCDALDMIICVVMWAVVIYIIALTCFFVGGFALLAFACVVAGTDLFDAASGVTDFVNGLISLICGDEGAEAPDDIPEYPPEE